MRENPISSFYKVECIAFETFTDNLSQEITALCQSLFSSKNEAISALVNGTTIYVVCITAN